MQILRRPTADEQGFTLIELMVVVMIIAILMAIAVPTFLNARTKAQDRKAQAHLKNAFTAAKAEFADKQDFTVVTLALLQNGEPSVTFVNGASTGSRVVSYNNPAADTVAFAAKSDSGTCFDLKESALTVQYGSGSCDASNLAGVSDWSTQW